MRYFVAIYLSYLLCVSAHADILVEWPERLLSQQEQIPGGTYKWYTFTLEQGAKLNAQFAVAGGLDNAIQVYFLDLPNFQLLQAEQQFRLWPESSPNVIENGGFEFTTPTANVYHLVFDNRRALGSRSVSINFERHTSKPNEMANLIKSRYEALYETLGALFTFNKFDIYVGPCGQANAFSTPDIFMCKELIEELQTAGVQEAELFVFFHEAAHSLLNLWGYPLYDNEDAADEFAVVMLRLFEQENAALQAAQWWSRSSESEALAKLYMDDRHTLSPQRARNIIAWINKDEELLARWFKVLLPNLTDEAITIIATSEIEPSETSVSILELRKSALAEMRRREK